MLKLSVIGNIGNDPELKYSPSGAAFLRFNVASNYRVRTPEGDWQDHTEWVRCTVFGRRAESLATLLHKGTRVYVDGRLEARPWTSREGQVRAGLEVTASDVEFASSRQSDDDQPVGAVVTDGRAGRRPVPEAAPLETGRSGQQDDDVQDLPF